MLGRLPATALVLLFIPTTVADPAGTEEKPELADPPGNVQYSQLHIGARDHDYLDLLGVWVDHNSTNDSISLHLKVASSEDLERRASDWAVSCAISADFRPRPGDASAYTIRYGFTYSRERGWQSNVTADQGGPSQAIPIKATFEKALQKPGYYTWTVQRHSLLDYGTGFHDFFASCSELRYVAYEFTLPILNANYAKAESAEYVFPEDPEYPANRSVTSWEEEETMTPQASQPAPPTSTAGIGFVGLVIIVVAAALIRRRRP